MTAAPFDLVVYLPRTNQFYALCLWAPDDAHARARALDELDGVGGVQILTCHSMETSRSSDDWSPWFRVPAAES